MENKRVASQIFKDGDILLCVGRDLISKLIKWGTNSTYSHVAIVASADLGLIIEAIPAGGVRAISIENFKESYDIYRIKSNQLFNNIGVISYLIKMLARKYDFKSAIRLGWKMFLRRLRLVKLAGLKMVRLKDMSDALQEDQDYFCSELCYKAFCLGGGLDIVPEIGDGETISPGDIARSSMIEKVVNENK